MSVLEDKPRRMAGTSSSMAVQARMPWALRALVFLLFVTAAGAAVYYGCQLRRWTWETTKPIRFQSDIERGYGWGRQCLKDGYATPYERIAPIQKPGSQLWLDYGPLRLAVMWRWAEYNRAHLVKPANANANTSNFGGLYARQVGNKYKPSNVSPDDTWLDTWQPDYEFNKPVLWFNTGMELLAALGAFVLTRHWVRRSEQTPRSGRAWYARLWGFVRRQPAPAATGPEPALRRPRDFRGWPSGFLAALLVWFSPGMIVSAHGWPTWDMWIIPLYLWAVYFASLECWFLAGLTIATGALFKGQQIVIAPVFLLWALAAGRPGGALKWVAGFLLAMGAWTSVWLVSYLPEGTKDTLRLVDWRAVYWIAGVSAAGLALPWLVYLRQPAKAWLRWPWLWRSACILAAALLALEAWVWPFWGLPDPGATPSWSDWLLGRAGWGAHPLPGFNGALMLAALTLSLAFVARRWRSCYLAAASCGGALLLTMLWFHGSHTWIDCGFLYATEHWPSMAIGTADNLPNILAMEFGLAPNGCKTTLFTLGGHALWLWPAVDTEISYRTFLWACFLLALLAAGIGMGLQARRNSARFLVALATPWLLFFTFPAQVHERYLLFGAGIGAVMVGWRWGMGYIVAFLSIVTAIMTTHCMTSNNYWQLERAWGPASTRKLIRLFDGTYPHLGWAVIVATLLCLYITVTSDKKGLK